ncbi:FkbM family methyltransferase [Mucilaginibacter lappiensis]|uniref:FkbM family methyltransferase n=1 Tax=Mucilaginibacter lappiensis TaxID=354630 RepID=A0A841JU83_9SPHI|nr:FkbM family methyltransferase [Mucilaginibacter lappiensis]MBB6131815.1 FkbM family methyltransferase [Mucilaginibacter lappiensis]
MLISLYELIAKYQISPTGVLHIGGHFAEEAHEYFKNGVERTIWIEANPNYLPIMEDALKDYSNYIVFNECMTDENDKEVELKISNNEGQSSSILDLEYHSIAHPEIWYIGKIKLKTKRLDSLFIEKDLDIKRYPFVNIDIQGAELLALKGFGDLLYNVKYLYLEINEKEVYKNCALIGEIDEYLETYGFVKKEQIMCADFGWGEAFYINQY